MAGRQLTRTFRLAFDGRVSRRQAGTAVPSRPAFCRAFFAARVLNFPAVSRSRQPVHHLHRSVGVIARSDRDSRCCFVTLKLHLGEFDAHTARAQVGAEAEMTVDGRGDSWFRIL